MLVQSFLCARCRPAHLMLLAAAVVSLACVGPADAQVRYQLADEQPEITPVAYYHGHRPRCNCPQCQQGYPCPSAGAPAYPQPGYQYQQPGVQPPMATPGTETAPMPPTTEPMTSPMATPSPSDQVPGDFAAGGGDFAFGGEAASPTAAYIDDARIWNIVRFRFDAGFDNEFPDRAEFFYPQCGCFPGAPGPGTPAGPGGNPPPRAASSVDYQEYIAYLEYAMSDRFSLFIDVPVRSIDPEFPGGDVFDSATGISDINAGFKYALVACPWHYDTIQFRVYTPTGDGGEGLGTAHVSLEPSYLAYRELTDRLRFNGEFRVWIPLSDTRLDLDNSQFDGELWAGTVLRYGVGLTYDIHQNYDCCNCCMNRFSAVFEAVGWSVLDGLKFNPAVAGGNVLDASGDTILNLKLGARWTCCDTSLFVGYGHAVTDEAWYRDIIRAELAYLY